MMMAKHVTVSSVKSLSDSVAQKAAYDVLLNTIKSSIYPTDYYLLTTTSHIFIKTVSSTVYRLAISNHMTAFKIYSQDYSVFMWSGSQFNVLTY